MNYREIPLVFECAQCRLVGIATLPDTPTAIGVLVVVGGPQYRAGSHRQFTLLARDLAEGGIPSLRFDYRGMGDSEGAMRTFETVGEDLRAAIDAFLATVPSVRQVAIWGLCDAASAALYYAHTDPRVHGLILLNPWVHSEAGAGRARLKHYYLARLLQASFWSKLLSGHVRLWDSLLGLAKDLAHVSVKRKQAGRAISATEPPRPPMAEQPYIDRMLAGLRCYTGNVLFILSGNDLVAQEFRELTLADRAWQAAYRTSKVETHLLQDANHTFSTRAHRGQASHLTRQWLEKQL